MSREVNGYHIIIWNAYLKSLEKNPLSTRAATSATLNVIGDFIAHQLEGKKEHDWQRTIKFGLIFNFEINFIASYGGLVSTPMVYVWYKILDYFFQGRTVSFFQGFTNV